MPGAEESNLPPVEASPVHTSNVTANPESTTVKTTTMKSFVPTVAGERGIFAPWPKKVN